MARSSQTLRVPQLAVLIPAYNRQDKLDKTVASLVAPAVSFDIIIVDDGSDRPLAAPEHPGNGRVILHRLEENQGVVGALRAGLSLIQRAGYMYMARIDCGDEAVPGRFERQLHHMRSNPDCALVGGQVDLMDTDGHLIAHVPLPTEPRDIRRQLHLGSCFFHSGVMMHVGSVIACGGYRDKYPHAEDFDLFMRLTRKFETANLPHTVVRYEVTADSLSYRHAAGQARSTLRILRDFFNPLMIESYEGLVRTLLVHLMPARALPGLERVKWSGVKETPPTVLPG